MTPEEITEALRPYGQHIARSTLTQYARIGVIGSPSVRGLGRGKGTLSEYPPETPAEIVAARTLVGTTVYPVTLVHKGEVVHLNVPGGVRITLERLATVRHIAYTKTAGGFQRALYEASVASWRAAMGIDDHEQHLPLFQMLLAWLSRRAWVLYRLPEPPRESQILTTLKKADPEALMVSLYDT
jgi:hypothetical protein